MPSKTRSESLAAYEREEAKELQKRSRPKIPIPKLGLSSQEFCEAHGFSTACYYDLKKQGLTPREMKLGNRIIISIEQAARWRAQRTEDAA